MPGSDNQEQDQRLVNVHQEQEPQMHAAQWFRDMRMSAAVNKDTVGVQTDRVTPQLLLKTTQSLLRISRGEQEQTAKDSLAYQKFYGPAQYFAEHIQRDGGKLARGILWKATNKGNLDFIQPNSLQGHISSVFYDSNLAQYIDGSTPFQAVDATYKTTRIGQGGISSAQSAPDQMRVVQPSYYGFVDPVRSPERGGVGLSGYLTKNVLRGSDGKLYQKFINARTGKQELVDSMTAAKSIISSADVMAQNTRSVFALGGRTGVQIVDRKDVDYYLPRPDDAYSTGANMVTMLDGIKQMRLLMGCLHPNTPMLVVNGNTMQLEVKEARDVYTSDYAYIPGCTTTGQDTLKRVDKVITRLTAGHKNFYKIILSSGRVILASQTHKWPTISGSKFKLVSSAKLKAGMRLPRTLYRHLPCIQTFIQQRPVTPQIAVLLGRIQRTLQVTQSGTIRVSCVPQQLEVIKEALRQLNVSAYRKYTDKSSAPSLLISDQEFCAWVRDTFREQRTDRRVPSAILSADHKIVAAFLDAYTKQVDNLGMDQNGDVWLMNIDNELVRTSLAYLLSRIYTDSHYRDICDGESTMLALKLVPVRPTFGDCTVDTIKAVVPIKCPGYMIDFDMGDDVYSVGNGVITHNSKYATQAVPLIDRQVPLVQTIDRATGKTMQQLVGHKLGTRWAQKPGVVTAVRQDRIDIVYDDGTKGSVDLYKNFPANIKGFISNTPLVKAGQRIKKDQILASSNYTDQNGVQAMGRNLRVGYISYKGGTYQDACVVSQSAAKKMTSRTMYKTQLDLDKTIRTGKHLYQMWKPQEYTRERLQNLSEQGVVRPGTVVHRGDPLVLAIQTTQPSPGTMGKRLLTDKSEVWQHDHPGTITDVVRTRNGIKIYATVDSPLQVGDKVSGRYGNKGTVTQVLPDDQMPVDSEGRPLQMLMSPLGIVSRCYDAQTQFRTPHAWKYARDIKPDDPLLCLDTNTYTRVYMKQLQPMHISKYTGKMYSVATDHVDFRVTSNHRMFASTTQCLRDFREYTVDQLYGKQCWIPGLAFRSADEEQSVMAKALIVGHRFIKQCMGHKDMFLHIAPWQWQCQWVQDQTVYCPSVPTGFVKTRRNGRQSYMGNTNPSQLIQTQLAKIAQKTGKPIRINQFQPGDRIEMVKKLSKQHGIPMSQDVHDPASGRTLKNILTGKQYIYKLKHMAQSKMSARGTATYTAQGVPASGGQQGSKRFGSLQAIAMIGHNAFDTLVQDAKLIRGQQNAEFWRKIRTGQIPTIPGQPLVHKKFFAHLEGSGVHIRKTTKGISAFALTDADVRQLTGPRQLKTRDTYQSRTFRPMQGGLFGTDIFGMNGDRWAYLQLDEPVLNPVMQQSVARILRIPEKRLQNILEGKEQLNGKSGSLAILQALKQIDLKKQVKTALEQVKTASKSQKDAAVKRYVALQQINRQGKHPADYMLTRIPVLPPIFRPITASNGLTMVADSNYLYAQLIDARNDLRDASQLPQEYKQQARSSLYKRYKQLVGLYDPQDKKLQQKSVKGLLKWALGDSPKTSALQRKVFGAIVDTVGRGVVVPDSRLKLNQLGIPEPMAWNIFSPFIARHLVNSGYTAVDALKQVKQRSPAARQYLMKAMQARPVLMNRAPSLHKLSIMGFKPRLVTGHAIHVHPSIVVPYNMDFDGDTVNIHVPVAKRAVDEINARMLPQRNLVALKDRKVLYRPQKQYIQGLYIATRMKQGKKPKKFATLADARRAYHQGTLDVDDPIQIGS